MSVSVIRRGCKTCGQMRPFERHSPNWVLHLILAVLTLGLWLLPMAVLALASMFRPWRCRECGQTKWL